MTNKFAKLAALVLAFTVALAGCGLFGGDDGNETSAEAPEEEVEETPEPDPTATPVPSQNDPAEEETEAGTDEGAVEAPDGAEGEEGELGAEGDPAPDSGIEDEIDVDLSVPAFNENSKVSTVGLDELFFGMTSDEAARAVGTQWETEGNVASECWFATPVNGPVGLEVMMWNGGVERIDVSSEVITTRSGVGVGSTAEELAELFGDSLDDSNPDQLAFVPQDEGDADFRIFFNMEAGVVTDYVAGRLPMAELPSCP